MFKRTALLALVASAVVGLTTLVSTNADARPHGGGNGGASHRVVGGGAPGMTRTPGIVRHGGGIGAHRTMIRHIHGHHNHHPHRHVRHCFWHPHHCHGHHVHLHWRRYWVGGAYTYPLVRPVVARPVASTCTCLVKEYLPNGAVLFRDVCTNESALNPPAQAAAVPQ